MESTEEIFETVDKLNEGLTEDMVGLGYTFSVRYFGSDIYCLKFNDAVLWYSEEDADRYLEETDSYEDLYSYCKRKFTELVMTMQEINLRLLDAENEDYKLHENINALTNEDILQIFKEVLGKKDPASYGYYDVYRYENNKELTLEFRKPNDIKNCQWFHIHIPDMNISCSTDLNNVEIANTHAGSDKVLPVIKRILTFKNFQKNGE